MCQTRRSNSSTGQSYACTWTSCGKQTVTAPVVGRVGQHAHRAHQRRGELLGPPDPVEVGRDRAERVVDGEVAGVRLLELLQQRRGGAVRERVGGQQQHGQPVDRRQRGAGQHVRRAGPDAGGDDPGLAALLHPRVRDGGVHHRLLVAAEHVRQQLGLLELGLEQRLPDAGDVAVAEDAEAAGEELLLDPVGLAVLGAEEVDRRLRDGHPHGLGHQESSLAVSRGSTSWSAHVLRIQVWSGWSVISQARPPCAAASGWGGPAITFR